MGYTLITHFDTEGYEKLHSILSVISDERFCRVPYRRVENAKRYQVDTLPYHVTVSFSEGPLCHLLSALDQLQFAPFPIKIIGLDIMPGKDSSKVLYLKIAKNVTMDMLQMKVCKLTGNMKYLPTCHEPHITLCISKDYEKIERINNRLLCDFKPFWLTVKSLGLYEIWPGKLLYEYHFTKATNHPWWFYMGTSGHNAEIKEYSITDDIEILGHVFHGLDDIKEHVEISLYRDFSLGEAINQKPNKTCGVHVGEMWMPHLCIDSGKFMNENTMYQNYIFRNRPITQGDMRKLSELPSGIDECRVLNNMPQDALPMLYYVGSGSTLLLVV